MKTPNNCLVKPLFIVLNTLLVYLHKADLVGPILSTIDIDEFIANILHYINIHYLHTHVTLHKYTIN